MNREKKMATIASPTAERLVLKNSDGSFKPMVEINGSEITIYDEVLRGNMEQIGVSIPIASRGEFGGQRKVYLEKGDKQLFIKAFKEFYYRGMPSTHYSWVALTTTK